MQQNRKNTKGDEYFSKALYMSVFFSADFVLLPVAMQRSLQFKVFFHRPTYLLSPYRLYDWWGPTRPCHDVMLHHLMRTPLEKSNQLLHLIDQREGVAVHEPTLQYLEWRRLAGPVGSWSKQEYSLFAPGDLYTLISRCWSWHPLPRITYLPALWYIYEKLYLSLKAIL